MKRSCAILATMIVATTLRADPVKWQDDYQQAISAAKKDNKLVMVDVCTDWCPPCKMLDRDVYGNASVQARLAKDFIPVKVNPEKSEKGAELAHRLGTYAYPHISFINGDGKKIYEIVGYVPVNEFLKKLDKASQSAHTTGK